MLKGHNTPLFLKLAHQISSALLRNQSNTNALDLTNPVHMFSQCLQKGRKYLLGDGVKNKVLYLLNRIVYSCNLKIKKGKLTHLNNIEPYFLEFSDEKKLGIKTQPLKDNYFIS